MSTENSPITPDSRKRRGWALLAIFASVLVVVILVVLVVWRGGAEVPSASGATDRPQPSETQAPIAVSSTPTPATTDAAPADSRIPVDCEQLYTTDWAASLGPVLVLNPVWTKDSPASEARGSNDSGLVTQLDATNRLTCHWARDAGGSDLGLVTNVAALTDEQQASLTSYIGGIGYLCYDELDGLRCVTERSDDGAAWGESHFIRDGIWLATRWINVSPDGYTHDMVTTIFGTA